MMDSYLELKKIFYNPWSITNYLDKKQVRAYWQIQVQIV